MSSVVRKCVEKATGKEYACKIMEFNDDSIDERAARNHSNITSQREKNVMGSFVTIVAFSPIIIIMTN